MKELSGLGTDIIEVKRIERAVARHGPRFINHLFTPNEITYCKRFSNPIPHFAGRFAAKEAVLKALGTGLTKELGWHDIEILANPHGKPEVLLTPKLLKMYPAISFFLSISHTETYATATAIAQKVKNT